MLTSRRGLANVFVAVTGMIVTLFVNVGVLPPDVALYGILALSFYFVFLVRRNRMLLYVFMIIAYANYSICYSNYLNPLSGTMFTGYAGTTLFWSGINALLLFMSVLLLFFPHEIRCFGLGDRYFRQRPCNSPLVVALSILLVVILVYGFGRPDSIGGDRGSPSALYEYSTIFFIVGFWFAGEKRWSNNVLTIILLCYAAQNLVYGGRVSALQLLTILFFIRGSHLVGWKVIAPCAICGLILMTLIGNLRTTIWDSSMQDVVESVMYNIGRGFAWDTAYSSWHTSMTFLDFDQVVGEQGRQYYLQQWLLSIVLGGSSVADSQLAFVTRQFYPHWFGGVYPIFFQFYLGVIGTILSAAWIAVLMRLVNKSASSAGVEGTLTQDLRALCMLYVVISVPRWYLYTPSQVTRGLLLCFVVSMVLLLVDKLMSSGSMQLKNARNKKAIELRRYIESS